MYITSVSALLLDGRARAGLSQRELAARAGATQALVARIERGQANPTIDTIARIANAAGFEVKMELVPKPVRDPVVEAYKKDVDRTLLRENLKKTPDERVRTLMAMSRFSDEARRARLAAKTRRKS